MSRIVSVSVPATSANLGPGYDALGLALEIRDFVTAQFTDDNRNYDWIFGTFQSPLGIFQTIASNGANDC